MKKSLRLILLVMAITTLSQANLLAWSEPTQITTGGTAPSLIQDSSEKYWVAFSYGGDVYMANSPDGITWGTPTKITNWGNCSFSTLIQDAGGIYRLAFGAGSAEPYKIYAMSSFDGVNWSSPVQVPTAGTSFEPCIIQDSNGKYWLTYNTYWGIYITSSDDFVNWGSSTNIVSGFMAGSWLIQDSAEKYWVAYYYHGGNWPVYITSSSNGTSWDSPIEIVSGQDDGYYDARNPELIQDSTGTYWMTYGTVDQGGKHDIALISSLDGVSWGSPVIVAGGDSDDGYTSSIIQDVSGMYWVVFPSDRSGAWNLWITSITAQEIGLFAYWKFDEGSGFIAGDSSGNGKDGIIDGATWTTGKIGDALSFDGFDDWVDIPDNISPEHITLEVWIYPTGFDDGPGDQGNAIIQRSTGGAGAPGDRSWSWRLRIMPRSHLAQFQAAGPNTGVGSVVAPTALVQNRWYHLAATYDGNVMKIYVDGEVKATYSNLDGPLETYHLIPVAIGCLEGWGLQHFQGIIDEVRVYGRALTEEEIAGSISCIGYAKPGPQTGNSSDIVLIYIGHYDFDSNWAPDDFTPYISHVNRNNVPYADKWMFDSFLFLALESANTTNGKHRRFMWAKPDHPTDPAYPSRKDDWVWLLNRFFLPGKQLDALHAKASELSRQVNVFVMIPYPDPHATDTFGDVDNDGINEDFTNNTDRYKAIAWYANKFLTEWNARNYDDFLKLVGFYWMHEAVYADRTYPDDALLLRDISEYIHSTNYIFMWIPYQGEWVQPWQSYGFDFAMIQPNYYQTAERTKDDLRATADFAKGNCLGIEVEFDDRLINNIEFRERFQHYLDVGEEKGYREESVLAYYQQFNTVKLLAESQSTRIRNLYDDLYRFINRSAQLEPWGDADVDGIPDDIESATGTDPFDDDTDNDGLLDGPGSGEDVNANGVVDPGETDPRNADTDGDGIQDGTECGLVAPDGLDTDLTVFVSDADPNSTTDPTNPDTDGDGLLDGEEDFNGNGAVDPGETDPSAITGIMDIEPNVLNLKSKGKWVTCYIELPQGYDATDIILPSVALNSTIPPEFSVYEFGDYNANGIIDLMVKFDRELLIGVLGSVEHGQDIMLTLTGQLSNGTRFEGLNTIRVIKPGQG